MSCSRDLVIVGSLLLVYWVFVMPVSWLYISVVAVTLVVYLFIIWRRRRGGCGRGEIR